ncbi:hypothetical protein [Novipirellula aureliae]|nr:hypothetical protein [Novipirellula aureliae]
MKHPSIELVSAEETSGGYRPRARKKFAPPPRIAPGDSWGWGERGILRSW